MKWSLLIESGGTSEHVRASIDRTVTPQRARSRPHARDGGADLRARACDAAGAQTWLVVSDVHLDPFDRQTHPSLFGSDTNLALFRSALAEMRRRVPDPAAVLLPGDFFAHDFAGRARARRRARRRCSGRQNDAFHRRRVRARLSARALCRRARQQRRALRRLSHGLRHSLRGRDRTHLGTAGESRRRGSGASPRRLPRTDRTPRTRRCPERASSSSTTCRSRRCIWAIARTARTTALEAQLEWLRATLASTPSGTTNVVLMHIPPGYDAFSTERTRGFFPWPFLEAGANERTSVRTFERGEPHRVRRRGARASFRFSARGRRSGRRLRLALTHLSQQPRLLRARRRRRRATARRARVRVRRVDAVVAAFAQFRRQMAHGIARRGVVAPPARAAGRRRGAAPRVGRRIERMALELEHCVGHVGELVAHSVVCASLSRR